MTKLLNKILILSTIFFISLIIAHDKNLSFKCTGKSQFEIVGSPGVKEEIKTISYKINNGELQDLNNISCEFKNDTIVCESSFLNFRKLVINQKTKKVSDFISGNKGFGQYTENFEGNCD